MDALLIFGIPYFVSLEPGDVWGSDAYGGKEIFVGTMREEKKVEIKEVDQIGE